MKTNKKYLCNSFLFILFSSVFFVGLINMGIVFGATLGSTSVEPGTLLTGATGIVRVGFTTVGAIPDDGKIKITFPAGFDINSASGSCSTMDGSFASSVGGQTLTLTRSGGTLQSAGVESCVLSNVKNPPSAGTTGTYTIETTTSADVEIDSDNAIPGSAIVSNALTGTDVILDSTGARVTTNAQIIFTTSNNIVHTDKLKVTFPSGFDLTTISNFSCPTIDSTTSFSIDGQVATITFTSPALNENPGAQTCNIFDIVNPAAAGSTGTYSFQITDGFDAVRDQNLAVQADTITTNAFTDAAAELSSYQTGATVTATLSFTTLTPLYASDKLSFEFDENFDVSGASGGNCPGMDGSFTTSVAGQTITLTRSGGSAQPAGAQTCTINTIINPDSAIVTSAYTFRTSDENDAVIHEKNDIAGSTIIQGNVSMAGGSDSSSPSEAPNIPDAPNPPPTEPESLPEMPPSDPTPEAKPEVTEAECADGLDVQDGFIPQFTELKGENHKIFFQNGTIVTVEDLPYSGTLCPAVKLPESGLPKSLPASLTFRSALQVKENLEWHLSKPAKVILALPGDTNFKNLRAYGYNPISKAYHAIDQGGTAVESNSTLVVDTSSLSILVAVEVPEPVIIAPAPAPTPTPAPTTIPAPAPAQTPPILPSRPAAPAPIEIVPPTPPVSEPKEELPATLSPAPSASSIPQISDSDNDGISDNLESIYGTDPQKYDTDGDGSSDGEELLVYKTDPADANAKVDPNNIPLQINNLEPAQEIADPRPFIKGTAKAGAEVEIFIVEADGQFRTLCKTFAGSNNVFACSIDENLPDGEYEFGVKTSRLADNTFAADVLKENRPTTIRVKINSKAGIETPKPEKLADAIIQEEDLLKNIRLEIRDNRPVLYGKTAFNHQIIATWKSVILTSTLLVDSTAGEFAINPTEILEPGVHEVYLQSQRMADKTLSKAVKVSFAINEGQSPGVINPEDISEPLKTGTNFTPWMLGFGGTIAFLAVLILLKRRRPPLN